MQASEADRCNYVELKRDDLTWREQHGGAEESHVLVSHLQTTQAFGQIIHGVHKVIAAWSKWKKKWEKGECLGQYPNRKSTGSVCESDLMGTHRALWKNAAMRTFHQRASCCWWSYKPDSCGSGERPCNLGTHTKKKNPVSTKFSGTSRKLSRNDFQKDELLSSSVYWRLFLVVHKEAFYHLNSLLETI